MNLKSLFAVFFILMQPALQAQTESAFQVLKFEKSVLHTSIDRLGNFYFLFEDQLVKTDLNGKTLASKKNDFLKDEVFLEAWNPLRVIVHQQGKHRCQLLGPDLEPYKENLDIDPAFALAPLLVGNGSRSEIMWVLDEDYSLKEIDVTNIKILTESAPIFDTREKRNFTSIRLYQNFLFILEEGKGVHILSRTGKLLRTIPTTHNVFGVLGEDFYYREGDKIVFEDLYTGDQYKVSLSQNCNQVLATDERLVLINGNQISFFRFQPKQ